MSTLGNVQWSERWFRLPGPDVRGRLTIYAWLMVAVAIAVPMTRIWMDAARVGFFWPVWGQDADLYLDATRRWLAGRPFYPVQELWGPFRVFDMPRGGQPILYPPTSILLFAPFTFLPIQLWTALPIAITAVMTMSHRPRRLAWLVIALLACWPSSAMAVVSGNPVLWAMAFLALGTRWPAFAPWVMFKPSVLAVFSLFGARSHGWSSGLVGFVVASALFLPMWPDYFTVLANARVEAGPFYGLGQASLLLIPVAAWAGRSRRHPREAS